MVTIPIYYRHDGRFRGEGPKHKYVSPRISRRIRTMPHECDACGETFDTLSRLRLHDCPADEPADRDPLSSFDAFRIRFRMGSTPTCSDGTGSARHRDWTPRAIR